MLYRDEAAEWIWDEMLDSVVLQPIDDVGDLARMFLFASTPVLSVECNCVPVVWS